MISPEKLLKKYFGYDNFRPMQAKIIQSLLDKNDTLVLMPTGGGKSLCYQIPALMKPGLCIVVSPLISLMKDQVDSLINNGIPSAYLNSSLDIDTQNSVIQKCINKQIKLLYISPERVAKEIDFLFKRININLFAIDEAHCVSSWGHDFRPEYVNLFKLKSAFQDVPIVALTATANSQTRSDIIKQLSLNNPSVFVVSFDRPNLSIVVRQNIKPRERTKEIISFIKSRINDSGIIYCLSRNNCDTLVETLKEYGIKAASYHAGLPDSIRQHVQDAFIKDDIQVVCATIAFGMGIDKPNVRYVIHYSVPKSLEGYYQEIGRAGRDGLSSDTILYFNYADLRLLRSFAEEGKQTKLNLVQLNHVKQYSESKSCRRQLLLSYFGEKSQSNCGNCDICKPDIVYQNTSQQSENKILTPGNEKYSSDIFNSLREIRKEIADAANVPAFIVFSDATLRDMSIKQPRTEKELLDVSGIGQFKLEKYGQKFLDFFNRLELITNNLVINCETTVPNIKSEIDFDKGSIIFNKLKQLRKQIADTEKVPAYVVFKDSTLKEIATKLPKTDKELLNIAGIGQSKLDKYGQIVINFIESLEYSDISPTFVDDVETRTIKNSQQSKNGRNNDEILRLYNHGLTIEEIAEKVNLKDNTVFGHVLTLYKLDKIEFPYHLATKEEVTEVQKILHTFESLDRLKPIYEALGGMISYNKLKFILAYLDKNNLLDNQDK